MTGPETYADGAVTIHHGDCLDVLRTLPDNSVHAVVTDPPYALGFMGKDWDSHATAHAFQAWCELWAAECLRVLRPGGFLLAFGGTRTFHRLTCGVEDAGFEVRDSIAWLYGSGFPKSLDVSKAIDKTRKDNAEWRAVGQWLRSHREAAGFSTRADFAPHILDGHKNLDSAAANLSNWENGLSFPTWDRWLSLKGLLDLPDDMDAEVWRLNGRKGSPDEAWERREVIVQRQVRDRRNDETVIGLGHSGSADITTPATDAARQWDGWGTALKPSHEPIVVARKPLQGTVAGNVTEWGTGALNIAACRVAADWTTDPNRRGWQGGNSASVGATGNFGNTGERVAQPNAGGRWPANVALSGDRYPLARLRPVVPTETERQIREHFHANTDHLPPAGNGTTEALLAGLRPRMDPCAAAGEAPTGTHDPCDPFPVPLPLVPQRWQQYFELTGAETASTADTLDAQSGPVGSNSGTPTRSDGTRNAQGLYSPGEAGTSQRWETRSGGASRFFPVFDDDPLPTFKYQAKAPTRERASYVKDDGTKVAHATVKPLALMRWLVRLVTPPGGVVLEPFAGSGTTVEACLLEGFACVAVEREVDYLPLIRARVDRAVASRAAVAPVSQLGLFGDDGDAA